MQTLMGMQNIWQMADSEFHPATQQVIRGDAGIACLLSFFLRLRLRGFAPRPSIPALGGITTEEFNHEAV
jgi:hypothetical protein